MFPLDKRCCLIVIKIIEKITNRAIMYLSYISIIFLIAMILLVTFDVLSRRFLGWPIIGSVDICSAMLAVIVAFGIAYTEHNEGHIEVTVFMDKLSKQIQLPINIVFAFIALVFWGVVVWQCIVGAFDTSRMGAASGVLAIPTYPFPAFIALGALLLAMKLLFKIMTYFGILEKPKVDIAKEEVIG